MDSVAAAVFVLATEVKGSCLMSEAAELRCSRRLCAAVCRQSRSSFLASFALLDGPRRQAMSALYAFARITDDLGDSGEPINVRAAKLAHWRRLLWLHCAGDDAKSRLGESCDDKSGTRIGEPCDDGPTIWPAVRDCVSQFGVPVRLLDDIVAGVCMDLESQQPSDWLELQRYCYHVASSVGLCCTHIWQAEENGQEESRRPSGLAVHVAQSAIDCGLAFQLTNILRDIAEDARNGRIYIPQTLFASYDVDREEWLAGQPVGQWEAMLDELAERARLLYIAGWPTIDALTPRSQRMFSLMWRGYRSLLERIAVNKSSLWGNRRVRLSQRQRFGLLTTHFCSPIYARLSPPHQCQ